MPDFLIDYTQVTLEENIPFNKYDLAYLEEKRKSYKKLPVIMGFITLFTLGLLCWFIRDKFKTFTYSEYLLLVGAGFYLYFFCYLVSWLLMQYDLHNQRKDIQFGKCKLISIIINRDKTEYGEYLTFAGPSEKDKIRIQVTAANYKHYSIGTNIVVEYLKYSKEALLIVEL